MKRHSQSPVLWPYLRVYSAALFIIAAYILAACGGAAPEAEFVEARASINRGEIVEAQDIRVAEYVQYFDQQLPAPTQDAVGLDLRLGNTQLPVTGGNAYLQIGLQAREISSTNDTLPLNLAFVIDASGSMDEADKMPLVKRGLITFIEQLDPDDQVAIVIYNNDATVISGARFVDDGKWVREAVERIQPTGNTNLHAGMMEGFRQVDANFDVRRNNRVILLTDGVANKGQVDPYRIAADALSYNERGIQLSTIGLGADYNGDLLSDLATQGNGGYSYIDGAAEIDRVFRENAATFREMVATDIKLALIPEPGIQLVTLTGVNGTLPTDGVSVPMWDLSTNSYQVLLAKLDANSVTRYGTGMQKIATVEVTYFDESARREQTLRQDVTVELLDPLYNYNPLWDLEVYRNVVIQDTAEGLREISNLFDAERYEQAWYLAGQLEAQLNDVFALTNDPQIDEQARLLRKYQQTLSSAVYEINGRAPDTRYLRASDLETLRGETQVQRLPEVQLDN